MNQPHIDKAIASTDAGIPRPRSTTDLRAGRPSASGKSGPL